MAIIEVSIVCKLGSILRLTTETGCLFTDLFSRREPLRPLRLGSKVWGSGLPGPQRTYNFRVPNFNFLIYILKKVGSLGSKRQDVSLIAIST